MPWLSKTCSISACGPSKARLRKRVGAEAVLVADHHELETGVAQPQQRGITPGDEAQLVVAVDLVVGRLLDQRAVAIDEQDRRAYGASRADLQCRHRHCRARQCRQQRVVLRRRADADAQRIAELRHRATCRARRCRHASRRSNADGGIVEAHQQEVGLRGIHAPHARQVGERRARCVRALARTCDARARLRAARPAPAHAAPRCTLGAGTGYGAWQRRSTAMTSGIARSAQPMRAAGQRVRLRQRAQHRQIVVVARSAEPATAHPRTRRRPRRPRPARGPRSRRARRRRARGQASAGRIARRAQEHQLGARRQRGAPRRVEIEREIPVAVDERHLARRARPASARRPRYMPNIGGVTSTTSSRPARQKARTSRSIASSLPRPTSSCRGSQPYRRGEALRASASGCGSG